MAKINGIFVTDLQGSVGKVTFRKTNGENIASQKVSTVKNPRTESQQVQRMTLRTVSAAYAGMKEICDHSFEGVSTGANCMARFMKLNLDLLKGADGNFNVKANPSAVPNPLIVSKGSIVAPSYSATDGDGPVIVLDAITGDVADMTVKQFHDALGLNVGDQITFVIIYKLANGASFNTASADYNQNQFGFMYKRLVYKVGSDDLTAFTKNSSAYVVNSAAVDTTVTTVDSSNVTFYAAANAKLSVTFAPSDAEAVTMDFAAGIIISRKSNSTWLRSNSTLVVGSGFITEAYTKAVALPSYDPTSAMYLNNAES